MSSQHPTHDTHTPDQLPPYAPMLFAFNRSFADDMRCIIADLPLHPNARVLDVACGDGSFTVWLAKRLDQTGRATGLDISEASLAIARQAVEKTGLAERTRFEQGDSTQLPYDDESFDLVWCAHSLFSLPDPEATLREMLRVTRTGGTVAVLENDPLHHLLLPWPTDVELAVRQAHMEAIKAADGDDSPLYVGRQLRQMLDDAGLKEAYVRTYTAVRNAPLSEDDRTFLQGYLDDVRERARPFLSPTMRDQLDALLDPHSPDALLNQPMFWMSCLEILGTGTK